ncbi:MAG: Clp protease ClpP, partial [bacterium]|nr:Clp protease ClpP [bacterium]
MSTLQLDIHGVIGMDVDSSMVAAILRNAGDVSEIGVSINSPGGSVHAGIAIYNLLRRHAAKVIVYVDGLAASIASVIMLAG